jgi:hypothetical protein
MTKIEQVARALDPDEWEIQDGLKENSPDYWAMPTQVEVRRASFARARAAIKAMREPTNEMVDAVSFSSTRYQAEPLTKGGFLVVDLHRSNPITEFASGDEATDFAEALGAREGFIAAIDAALNEKGD